MAIVLNRSQRSGGPGRTRWAEKRTMEFFDKWADSIRFQGPMRRGRGEKGGPIQFDSGCVSRYAMNVTAWSPRTKQRRFGATGSAVFAGKVWPSTKGPGAQDAWLVFIVLR
jgi:hypothetical protein